MRDAEAFLKDPAGLREYGDALFNGTAHRHMNSLHFQFVNFPDFYNAVMLRYRKLRFFGAGRIAATE